MRNRSILVCVRMAAACAVVSLFAVPELAQDDEARRRAGRTASRRTTEADAALAGRHGEFRRASRRKRQLGRRRAARDQSEELRSPAGPRPSHRSDGHQGRSSSAVGARAARLPAREVHRRRAVHALQAVARPALVRDGVRRRAAESAGKRSGLPVPAGRLPYVPNDLHGRTASSDGQGSGAELSRSLDRPLGRRHAGDRYGRLQRAHLDEPGCAAAHRSAAHDRAPDAAEFRTR